MDINTYIEAVSFGVMIASFLIALKPSPPRSDVTGPWLEWFNFKILSL